MSDMHSFSVDVAKEVGVNAAILLQSIKWWCAKNKANGKNEHDGLYWTYNSVKAWQELYPYLGKSAIDNALKKLEERGYIKTGNYNSTPYDRTKWYAITDEGLRLFENPFSENRNGNTENGNANNENKEPIPDTEQLPSSSDTDAAASKAPVKEIIEHLNAAMGKHYSMSANSTVSAINARWEEYPDMSYEDRLSMFIRTIDTMVTCWKGTRWEQYLKPSTLFRPTKFDEYTNMEPRKWEDWDSKDGRTQQSKPQRQMDLSEYGQPKPGDQRYDSSTGVTEVYQQDGTWKACEPSTDGGEYEDIDF